MTINILRGYSETQLLEMVQQILAAPGPLTGIQKEELKEINDEIQRRDLIRLAKKYHPSLQET